jgi:TRAP-type C4-dicarboxylate transport system permease large subunit
VLVNVLGLLTPPVGPVLNVACATGRVKMEEILVPVLPYFIVQCLLLLVMTLIPETIMVPLKWFAGYTPKVPVPSILGLFR